MEKHSDWQQLGSVVGGILSRVQERRESQQKFAAMTTETVNNDEVKPSPKRPAQLELLFPAVFAAQTPLVSPKRKHYVERRV